MITFKTLKSIRNLPKNDTEFMYKGKLFEYIITNYINNYENYEVFESGKDSVHIYNSERVEYIPFKGNYEYVFNFTNKTKRYKKN
jgi:hypothetical protein